jgi:hypothetical protein
MDADPAGWTNVRGSGSSADVSYWQAHGLFVGVEDVENPIGAAANAAYLSDALAPILSTSTTLTGPVATRKTILGQLENTIQEAHPRDLVIIYFSGRSERKYGSLSLHPSDFDATAYLATAVSSSLVSAVLGSRWDLKTLVILDTSGAAGVGFDMSRIRIGSEVGLMASCGANEESFSGTQDGKGGERYGNFTWELGEELSRWARKVEEEDSSAENALFLCDWFDGACARTVERDDRQHPVLLGVLSPNVTLRLKRKDDGQPREIGGGFRPH